MSGKRVPWVIRHGDKFIKMTFGGFTNVDTEKEASPFRTEADARAAIRILPFNAIAQRFGENQGNWK